MSVSARALSVAAAAAFAGGARGGAAGRSAAVGFMLWPTDACGTSSLLFVYGALQPSSGHPMAAFLAQYSRLVGPAWTPGRLVELEGFWALASADDARVEGVLLRLLDDTILRHVDAFEGGAYARVLREVFAAAPHERVEAWVYVLADAPAAASPAASRAPGAAGW